MLDFVIEVTNKAVEEGETTLLILDDVTQQLKNRTLYRKAMIFVTKS